MNFQYKIEGGDFSNAGFVSSNIKKVLKQLNVNPVIIKKIVIALYEAEVNIVAHAFQGNIEVEIEIDKIKINLNDTGPGIEDINKAMELGYSTASEKVREMGFGAGMGLSNIKRNSDFFNISSIVGEGTFLEIITLIK